MFPRLLICEGVEDHLFFHRLIEHRKIHRFHIQSAGGNTKFAAAVSQFELEHTREFKALADVVVVADCNDAPADRFDNACGEIKKCFGAAFVPAKPLTPTTSKPRCTVLMIPWAGEKGTLEAMCVEAAADADKTIAGHVKQFLAQVNAEKWPSTSRYGKAWLRANLAVRCAVDPFVPLGKVFHEKKHADLIPVAHKSFNRVADFLSKVGV